MTSLTSNLLICAMTMVPFAASQKLMRKSATESVGEGVHIHQHFQYSQQFPANSAVPVSAEEMGGTIPCTFVSENNGTANCQEDPQGFLRQHLKPNATVLELGARYGTATCEIASIQGNSGRLVSSEPDKNVWAALQHNIAKHQCNSNFLKGIVGTEHPTESENGYGSHTHFAKAVTKGGKIKAAGLVGEYTVPATPLKDVEKQFGFHIDTAVIDCEGCINHFLEQNPGALDQLQMVVMEMDQGQYKGNWQVPQSQCGNFCVDYDKVVSKFEKAGFKVLAVEGDSIALGK